MDPGGGLYKLLFTTTASVASPIQNSDPASFLELPVAIPWRISSPGMSIQTSLLLLSSLLASCGEAIVIGKAKLMVRIEDERGLRGEARGGS